MKYTKNSEKRQKQIIVPTRYEELISNIIDFNSEQMEKTMSKLNKYKEYPLSESVENWANGIAGDFDYQWKYNYSMLPEIAMLSYDEREKIKKVVEKILFPILDDAPDIQEIADQAYEDGCNA